MAIVSDPRELASLQRKKGATKLNPSQQAQRKETRNLVERIRQDVEVSYRYTRDWSLSMNSLNWSVATVTSPVSM